jgi:hypothetical protein
MGGVDLDLRAATLDLAGGSIDVNATIGGVQITVPSGWAVDLERHVVAGGVDARVAARELMPTTLPPFVCGLSRGWAESWSRPVRARDVRRRSRAAAVQAIPAAGRDSTLGAMTSLPAPRRTPPRDDEPQFGVQVAWSGSDGSFEMVVLLLADAVGQPGPGSSSRRWTCHPVARRWRSRRARGAAVRSPTGTPAPSATPAAARPDRPAP